MQFRWPAFIALWTVFMGPILGAPSGSGNASRPASVTTARPITTSAPAGCCK
jgi:hypothetical protein